MRTALSTRPQAPAPNPQSPSPNPQSPIPNPESRIPNPQSRPSARIAAFARPEPPMSPPLAYPRILPKLSGEALLGAQAHGTHPTVIRRLARGILQAPTPGAGIDAKGDRGGNERYVRLDCVRRRGLIKTH